MGWPFSGRRACRLLAGAGLWLALLAASMAAVHAAVSFAHDPPPQIAAAGFQPAYLAARIGQQSQSQKRVKRDQQGKHSQTQQPSPKITPQQAAQRARSHFGGRVLNVILERGTKGPYYRVKLLKHGRVRVVNIDADR